MCLCAMLMAACLGHYSDMHVRSSLWETMLQCHNHETGGRIDRENKILVRSTGFVVYNYTTLGPLRK